MTMSAYSELNDEARASLIADEQCDGLKLASLCHSLSNRLAERHSNHDEGMTRRINRRNQWQAMALRRGWCARDL